MIQDYKFRHGSTVDRQRRTRPGSRLIRLIMVLLAIGVLSLIIMTARDLWLARSQPPDRGDQGLIPLTLPPPSHGD